MAGMSLEWGFAQGKTPEGQLNLSQAFVQNHDKDEKIEIVNA
jgi:hypothetical protein